MTDRTEKALLGALEKLLEGNLYPNALVPSDDEFVTSADALATMPAGDRRKARAELRFWKRTKRKLDRLPDFTTPKELDEFETRLARLSDRKRNATAKELLIAVRGLRDRMRTFDGREGATLSALERLQAATEPVGDFARWVWGWVWKYGVAYVGANAFDSWVTDMDSDTAQHVVDDAQRGFAVEPEELAWAQQRVSDVAAGVELDSGFSMIVVIIVFYITILLISAAMGDDYGESRAAGERRRQRVDKRNRRDRGRFARQIRLNDMKRKIRDVINKRIAYLEENVS